MRRRRKVEAASGMSPTRAPLPPPFPVGAKVRYTGARTVTVGAADTWIGGKHYHAEPTTVLAPGLIVTIDDTKQGQRGTGRTIDPDDLGEPIIDETRDGWSAYTIAGHGRIIHAKDAHEWERVQP